MGWSLARVLIQTELDLDGDGWDRPPRLFVAYRTLAPPEVTAPGMDALLISVSEIPLPRGLYGPGTMPDILRMLAEEVIPAAAKGEVEIPDNILAWAVSFEAYVVVNPDPIDKGQDLSAHPDARELRWLIAVDNAGDQYAVVRERHTDTVRLLAQSSEVDLGGDIAEALRELVDATT